MGSVKSNIGHTEACSGLCSITKAILAFEHGQVAPNINFTEAKKSILPLVEGRLKVCVENTPLPGPLIAVNSFGFGGANGHVLLSINDTEKTSSTYPTDSLPRLITWEGRTEESVTKVLTKLSSMPLNSDFIGLIHNIQQYEVPANLYRGFGIFEGAGPTQNAKCIAEANVRSDAAKRPVIWLFTGMGSQWTGMGTSLMQLDQFRQSIQESHKVLEPFGLDLISIITSNDPTTFDNILNSFVGIAAIQIAIVNILRSLNVPQDYIIGHSVGELGCAYADDTLTAEQMILAAYARGLVSVETKVVRGSMAAVGLSYSNIKDKLPPTIEVACHNGAHSATLSGPKEEVARFVAELTEQKVFAREVACSNIPYHSRYIADMGPKLLEKLKSVIPKPKRRSAKWLCTSVAIDKWNNEATQYSSAEYHTNNLLSPVLFEETSEMLPKDAITIEIAPHGLLQAIIKKTLPNAIHVPLTHRGHENNALFFLSALGKMYINGVTMRIDRLYPTVQFPVARRTPMIAPFITWDHSQQLFVAAFDINKTEVTSERKLTVSLKDEDHEYMKGHVIDGKLIRIRNSFMSENQMIF